MKKNVLFALWGGMFILCAGLGFIPQPQGIGRTLLLLAALLFFLPPVLLLRWSKQHADRDLMRLLRNLSGLSLLLSLVAILLNIVFAAAPETAGLLLNSLLIVLSTPMICSGQWALSLFLWACLLMGSLSLLKKNP